MQKKHRHFDFADATILSEGALKPRSVIIPYPNEESARGGRNQLKQSLSGIWKFRYYVSPLFLPDEKGIPGDADDIPVPSCWQVFGYEKPFYVNNDFIFPANPPEVPIATPVGYYARKFTCADFSGKRVILTFLGSSAFHVYINGKRIGYAQGTHNMHEFDITDALKVGENVIAVTVYKWSDGSYLESQDMYRYSGIFREVYITYVPEQYIFDFNIKTQKTANGYELTVKVDYSGSGALSVRLDNAQGKAVAQGVLNENCGEFLIENADEWTCETPVLYDLYIILTENGVQTECIRDSIGFKTITYDSVFRINGKPIKIRGVNYHESNCSNGYVQTMEEFEKDVKLMKRLNINTVRFSHYPSHPYMLELCEREGLYVIDEADLETYGALNMADKDYFGRSKEFTAAFLDRMEHLYERDKNSVAVIMWSLGNESGIGENFDICYDFLTAKNSGIPIQYETCFRFDYDDYYADGKRRGYDIISVMYPSMELLDRMIADSDPRPFYMCEYAHCMGLGPGAMAEYRKKIESCERFIGGCVWEWCDHANIENKEERDVEKYRYLYGGDNGEYVHDGNFCCDGMVLPDRRLSSSAEEVAQIFRPVRFEFENGKLYALNTLSFADTKKFTFVLQINKNGISVRRQNFLLDVAPSAKKEAKGLDFSYECDGEWSVTIETLSNGERIGRDWFILRKEMPEIDTGKPAACESCGQTVHVCGKYYTAEYDRNYNTIVSLKIGEEEVLTDRPENNGYGEYMKNLKGFLPIVWHAPTDNDRPWKEEWFRRLYHRFWISYFDTEENDNCFSAEGPMGAAKYSSPFKVGVSYAFMSESIKIGVALTAVEDGTLPIPSFGIRTQISKRFGNVCWYGLGERENYPDFNEGCVLGEYSCRAERLEGLYIKPQENGKRCGVRRLRLTDNDGRGFEIVADGKPFAFSLRDVTTENLTVAKHSFDIKRSPFYELIIDGFVRGVGSASCGIPPLEDCELQLKKGETIRFGFFLRPVDEVR